MSGELGRSAQPQSQTETQTNGAEHAGGGGHSSGVGAHSTVFSSKGPIPQVAAAGAGSNTPSASDQAFGTHHDDHKQPKKKPSGFSKSGGGTVRDALTRLANDGKLKITAHQIAQLDALAQVESGGQVAAIDTTDDMVVSIGFHQVVLGHKSVEWVIKKAPGAFAKHGIELDMSRTYDVPGWSKPHQIKGVEDPDDLRGHEWGDRFYAASLEDDVIAAIVEWALKEAKEVDAKATKAGAKGSFWEDDTAHAWILEVDNNRQAYTSAVVNRAVAAGANSAKTREEFLDILAAAIIETYEDLEPKLVGYKYLKRKHHDWDDAKLHEQAEKTYKPIGHTKATHIVTRIGRHLKVPTLNANVAAAPVSAPDQAAAHDQPATAPHPAVAAATQTAHGANHPASTSHHAHHQPADAPAEHATAEHATAPETNASSSHAFTGAAHLRVTATGLNVRSSPTTHGHNILGLMHHGESIEGLDREGDWIAITYKGQRAYVHGHFVEATPIEATSGAQVAKPNGHAHTHHDAPSPVAATPIHDEPKPETEARSTHAHTRSHHEAPKPPHLEPDVVAAQQRHAAPARAPEETPQAKHDRLLQAEHAAILKEFEAGTIDAAGAFDRLFAFERAHNGDKLSALGVQLLYALPTELATRMQAYLAHTAHHHDSHAEHRESHANTPSTHAPSTHAPSREPAHVVNASTKTAAPEVKVDAGTFETANHNVIAKTDPKDEAKVLNAIRKEPRRFDPAWMLLAQQNLGVVDATGAMNTETLRAMRKKAGRHLEKDDIMHDDALLASFAAGQPFFAGTETGEHQKKPPKAGANSNKDKAVQELGFESFAEYRKLWGNDSVEFMGHDFGTPAHPYLRSRLKVAEAYLRQRITGPKGEKLTDADITKRLGWNTTGKESYGNASYAHAAGNENTHQHAMGLAIDIQPAQNTYMFESASGWVSYFEELSTYAHKIFGGEILHPKTLFHWADEMSTEELYLKVKSGSDSFAQLLTYSHGLGGNEQNADLLEKIEKAGYKGAEAKKVAHKIALADKDFHLQEGRRNAAAPMNLNEEMLIALRDVAGLAWGGAEIAEGENGDFMHFDCRNTDFGNKVYHAGKNHKPKT